MSSGKELEAPHTLASLPKPIDAVNGRTLASTVYSLSAARKRKRSEIAVSVDGDGISIFDVRLPQAPSVALRVDFSCRFKHRA